MVGTLLYTRVLPGMEFEIQEVARFRLSSPHIIYVLRIRIFLATVEIATPQIHPLCIWTETKENSAQQITASLKRNPKLIRSRAGNRSTGTTSKLETLTHMVKLTHTNKLYPSTNSAMPKRGHLLAKHETSYSTEKTNKN